MNGYIDPINQIQANTQKPANWIAYDKVWLSSPNRSVRLTYFTAVDALRNPTGNKNIDYIEYFDNEQLRMIVYYAWDDEDDIVDYRNYQFN